MPASLTRPCPRCGQERHTPDDFRDLDEPNIGRPPLVCRECRAKDPALQAAQARNIASRQEKRDARARRRARTPEQVAADRLRRHPSGRKVCPEGYGCGFEYPFSAFAVDVNASDGLLGVCLSCDADRRALRLARSV